MKQFVRDVVPEQNLESKHSDELNEKKRFFVSLMSESLIKKGVFFRLRKRIRVRNS